MEPTKGLDKIVRSPVDNSYTLFVPEKSIGIHRAKGGNGPFAPQGMIICVWAKSDIMLWRVCMPPLLRVEHTATPTLLRSTV